MPRMTAAPPSRRPDHSQSFGRKAQAEPMIEASRPVAEPAKPTRPARCNLSMRSSSTRMASMWRRSALPSSAFDRRAEAAAGCFAGAAFDAEWAADFVATRPAFVFVVAFAIRIRARAGRGSRAGA